MIRKIILRIVLILCLITACGAICIRSAFADSGGMDGGGGTVHGPVYTGGDLPPSTGPVRDVCRDIDEFDGSVNSRCNGYSWMFFKAVGPKSTVNFSPIPVSASCDGREESPCYGYYGLVYTTETVEDPKISGTCANPEYDRAGFWHFGQNFFLGDSEDATYYSLVRSQVYKRWSRRNEATGRDEYYWGVRWGGNKGFSFNKGSLAEWYNIGHFSSLNYKTNYKEMYKGDQYIEMANNNQLRRRAAEKFEISLDTLNNRGWSSEERGFNQNLDRGQQLWKNLTNDKGQKVWTRMYVAIGTKPASEVLGDYKKGYALQNGIPFDEIDERLKGLELPEWYYFCSWDFKDYVLTLVPVDERGNDLSKSVSWTGGKWQEMARQNQDVSVTAGTNAQYYFIGFKLKGMNEYFTNTNNSYANGMTFTIKSIGAHQTVNAVYRKVSLTAKAVDELGNPLDGRNGRNKIDDVTATGFTAGGAASVTRRTDNRYIFKGFKLADSAADTVNREFITTTNSGASYYVTGTPTEESARETFHVKSLADQLVVYAVYEEKSSFLGQIQLLEGTTQKAAVGYSDKTLPTVTYNINNCSPTDGCKVTFVHNFQRKSGDKTVTYTITRDSNYYVSNQGRGVESKTLVNNATENFAGVNNNTTKQIYKDEEMVSHPLYPGQVVCETLSFKPFVWKDDSVTLTLCASALGNAQPNDPADPGNPDNTGTPWDDPDGDNDNLNGASAFLKIEVKNESVSRYNTYRKIVYAKPNDKIKYRATYNPILQYTAYLKPQQMRIDGGSNIYPSSTTINTSQYLKDLFNLKKGSSLKNWNNAFYVSGVISNNYSNKCRNGECIYDVGVFTRQNEESNSVSVQPGDVGQELKETAVTNQTNNVKTTPSQVTFVSNGNVKFNLGNVITNQKVSETLVRVPYNFNIGACMKKAQNDTECAGSDLGVLDSGTKKSLYFEVDVNKKANSETAGGSSYATIVPKATTKIILYKGGVDNGGLVDGDICAKKYGLNADGINCNYSEVKEWQGANALNADGILEGVSKTIPATFDVPDAEAGTSYCVAAAVYPASSADVNAANYATSSTGWKDVEGNHLWQVSKSVCFIVGKKPTFQVWGGSFYGGGNITVSSTTKNNLTLPSGNITISNGILVFSSWVEQAVVAGGNVDKLASGAATGLVFNNDKNKAEGGSLENPESFCKYRVPLSIANYGSGLCQENSGNLTGNSNIIVNTNKKIFTEIATEGVERISVDGDYSTPNYPMIVSKGTTRIIEATGKGIIEATGKVIINGNIIYDENESYNSIEEIPKMVIYAKDIEINCSVTRIDAILLADGTIYSCGTSTGKGTVTDYNEARTRTNLLTVNGAIFTKQLELGRTYGMGTGTYSKIPAEIVNYDSSIILWAKGKSDTDDFEEMYQVYQHEMAPRY